MLYLRSCHTASLTTMQESYSQAVLKVQATPRVGQNDRLPSDALIKFLNGDSPFMSELFKNGSDKSAAVILVNLKCFLIVQECIYLCSCHPDDADKIVLPNSEWMKPFYHSVYNKNFP